MLIIYFLLNYFIVICTTYISLMRKKTFSKLEFRIVHFLRLTLTMTFNGAPLTLTPEEFAALKSLLKNKNLVI